ncbi:hypothetical protein [Virgibacillus salexigens]|uniref:Uncharacterized protein n=1 Tax=Virgibacillus massiliensis TaxID=1462526 RepID=A0A024QHY7_9BACI|nr:hypothetical protein [Virgibacillus massiliensis]CDQ41815.1 hypothetical protein BN990_04192 [Virgibacillus massiliensis]
MEYSSFSNKSDPYESDRLRSESGINFLGFIDVLKKLWEAAGKDSVIKRNFVKDDAENSRSIITYRTKERMPLEEFKEKFGPRHRSLTRHDLRSNEFIETKGQVQRVMVGFDIYSKSDEEADRIMEEFESFILQYSSFFKKKGIQQIFFFKQEEDENYTEFNASYAKRPLIYEMHFENITYHFLNQIEQLAIQAGIYNNENNEEES